MDISSIQPYKIPPVGSFQNTENPDKQPSLLNQIDKTPGTTLPGGYVVEDVNQNNMILKSEGDGKNYILPTDSETLLNLENITSQPLKNQSNMDENIAQFIEKNAQEIIQNRSGTNSVGAFVDILI